MADSNARNVNVWTAVISATPSQGRPRCNGTSHLGNGSWKSWKLQCTLIGTPALTVVVVKLSEPMLSKSMNDQLHSGPEGEQIQSDVEPTPRIGTHRERRNYARQKRYDSAGQFQTGNFLSATEPGNPPAESPEKMNKEYGNPKL